MIKIVESCFSVNLMTLADSNSLKRKLTIHTRVWNGQMNNTLYRVRLIKPKLEHTVFFVLF